MSLVKFLNTFNNANGSNFYVIDPMNTFEVEVSYTPGDSNVMHTQFIENISPYIQSIQLPNFSVTADNAAETLVGQFQTHKIFLTPESQQATVELINTKAPLIENWIYPWMREVTSPNWQYDDYPYTKAVFKIDLRSHANVIYYLNGVRPMSLDSYKPSHALPSGATRNVIFTFDFMYVETDESMMQNGTGSQLQSLAKNLVNKAAKTIGL